MLRKPVLARHRPHPAAPTALALALALALAIAAGSGCGSALSDERLDAALHVRSSHPAAEAGAGTPTHPGNAVPRPSSAAALPGGSEAITSPRPSAAGPLPPAGPPSEVSNLPAPNAPQNRLAGSDPRLPAAASPAGTGGPTRNPAEAESAGIPPARVAGSPIHLGSVGTQSGPIGAAIEPAPVAIRAWVADVNDRGGLSGHRIVLHLVDDGGDPGKALAATRRLVEQEGVTAFFGLFGVATLHAVIPYLEERRIPVVGAVPHPSVELSPVVFAPETGNSAINEAALTSLVLQSPARKVAVIICREIDSCPKALREMKAYSAKVGVTIVHEAQVSIAQPDYTADVLAARNSGAEAVVIVLDAPSVVRFIRSAHRQDWHPQFASTPEVYRQSFLAGGGDDVEGVIAGSTVLPFSISPRMAAYRDTIQRWAPGAPTGDWGALTWLGGKLFERISGSLGEPVTRDAIFAALHGLRNDTLDGLAPPLNFPERRTEPTSRCFVPLRVKGGKWTTPAGDTYSCNR